MFSIKYLVVVAIGALVGGFISYNAVNQTMNVGGFSDPFISLRLAADPDNGECLTTDGTNNTWSSTCGGGGGGGGVGWAVSSGTTTLYSNLNIPVIITQNDHTATGSDSVLDVWGDVTANYFTASSTAVTATSSFPRLAVTTALNLFGTVGSSLSDFCVAITGGAGLCDGSDDTGGAGGLGTTTPWTTSDIVIVANNGTVKSTSTIADSSIPAAIARDSELHNAVTVSGTPDYITLSGQDIVRGTVDIGDDTNLTVGATGIELSGDDISLTTGYIIPLSASTTNWNGFYNTPSSRITAGNALTWSTNTLNFDGGAAPAGELGGTWASPTIDDSLAVTSWNLTTPTLTSFFGTPCTGNQFLQDIGDTGTFSCATAAGGGGIATTSDIIGGPGTAETVGYYENDFIVGGTSSTTAEFLFDPELAQFTVASSTFANALIRANGTGILSIGASTGTAETLEWDFSGANLVNVLSGTGVTDLDFNTIDLHTDTIDFEGTGTINGLDVIDATTENTLEAAIDALVNLITVGTITTGTWAANLAADTVDAIAEIAAAIRTGSDAFLVTGTAGTDQNLIEWDANGDAIDSGLATADVVTGASTDTFTNKTFDVNGTGNSITNIDEADLNINTATNDYQLTASSTASGGWAWHSMNYLISKVTDAVDWGAITSFELPNSANPTVNATGEIAVNTATSTVDFFDGTNTQHLSPYFDKSFQIGSTTYDTALNSFDTATATFYIWNPNGQHTLTDIYCKTDTGNVSVRVGDGTNWSEVVRASSSGVEDDGTITNGTYINREDVRVEIGSQASNPNRLACTTTFKRTP